MTAISPLAARLLRGSVSTRAAMAFLVPGIMLYSQKNA